MRRLVLESPFRGATPEEQDANIAYAKRAFMDCLGRGESAIASHLLIAANGILDDADPDQRALGIQAGLAWHAVADAVVFYVDHGWSQGMVEARMNAETLGKVCEIRTLPFDAQLPSGSSTDILPTNSQPDLKG